jgi:hypothetical protein
VVTSSDTRRQRSLRRLMTANAAKCRDRVAARIDR